MNEAQPHDWAEILILGRDTCEDTVRCRGHLQDLGIPYVYRNVELDAGADAMNRSYNGGERVTPVILVGDPASPTSILVEPSNDELVTAVHGASGTGA